MCEGVVTPMGKKNLQTPRLREEDRLLMAVDPETREALRLGATPREQGPAFFTSIEAPFWLDGERGSVEVAAKRLSRRQ